MTGEVDNLVGFCEVFEGLPSGLPAGRIHVGEWIIQNYEPTRALQIPLGEAQPRCERQRTESALGKHCGGQCDFASHLDRCAGIHSDAVIGPASQIVESSGNGRFDFLHRVVVRSKGQHLIQLRLDAEKCRTGLVDSLERLCFCFQLFAHLFDAPLRRRIRQSGLFDFQIPKCRLAPLQTSLGAAQPGKISACIGESVRNLGQPFEFGLRLNDILRCFEGQRGQFVHVTVSGFCPDPISSSGLI